MHITMMSALFLFVTNSVPGGDMILNYCSGNFNASLSFQQIVIYIYIIHQIALKRYFLKNESILHCAGWKKNYVIFEISKVKHWEFL